MPKLIFYRQKRYDQAIRTGVELDGETIAERYEEGGSEPDPALLWYVDLRCEGSAIPDGLDEAARWLLDHAETIRSGFSAFAEHLRAGADPDIYSLIWDEFKDVPENVKMSIACSAARRIDAREMALILKEIADNWTTIIQKLDIPQEAEDLR
jgi:hypothetical protein